MAISKENIEAEARRVWPNAKRIDVTIVDSGRRVSAIDVNDEVIGQAGAETLDALKAKLEGMLPDGGQAP